MFDPKQIAEKIRQKRKELQALEAEQALDADDYDLDLDLVDDEQPIEAKPTTTNKSRLDKIFNR